jgi:cystathionine gamma-synthase
LNTALKSFEFILIMTKIDTFLANGGYYSDPLRGALIPSLAPSVSFERDESYALADGAVHARGYSKYGQENWTQVEAIVTRLEEAADSALFSSGKAAATTLLMTLEPGDHLVIHDSIYFAFIRWFRQFCSQFQIQLTLIDMRDMDIVRETLERAKPKMVWTESPTNPLWQVLDIQGIADATHRVGARLVVDNTVATPILTRPLTLGADIVLHSATKYLNGHGDVLAGLLVARCKDQFWQKLLTLRGNVGGVLGTFEAWLLLRGMRTLALRVRRASETALPVARYLEGHPKLEATYYPGLVSSPYHELARRQMSDAFGGMLSFTTLSDASSAKAVCCAARLFRRATSLGSTESLIEHRRTIEGVHSLCPENLIRLSIGLEDSQDLIADLDQALKAA